MEVKVQRGRVERVQILLKYEGLFFVEGVNSGGGIALLWKEKHMVMLVGYLKKFIDNGVGRKFPSAETHRLLWASKAVEQTSVLESSEELKESDRYSMVLIGRF